MSRPGQKIYGLLKSANGNLVPLGHIAAVSRIPEEECLELLDRLVQYHGVCCKGVAEKGRTVMYYWLEKR